MTLLRKRERTCWKRMCVVHIGIWWLYSTYIVTPEYISLGLKREFIESHMNLPFYFQVCHNLMYLWSCRGRHSGPSCWCHAWLAQGCFYHRSSFASRQLLLHCCLPVARGSMQDCQFATPNYGRQFVERRCGPWSNLGSLPKRSWELWLSLPICGRYRILCDSMQVTLIASNPAAAIDVLDDVAYSSFYCSPCLSTSFSFASRSRDWWTDRHRQKLYRSLSYVPCQANTQQCSVLIIHVALHSSDRGRAAGIWSVFSYDAGTCRVPVFQWLCTAQATK